MRVKPLLLLIAMYVLGVANGVVVTLAHGWRPH